jgi:predicted amidohydrolase
MTANKNFKRRVRTRAAKTGESYTAALRHFRTTPSGEPMQKDRNIRIAVAQNRVCHDPGNAEDMKRCGTEVRDLVRRARQHGAALVHFGEGTMCSPDKYVMSSTGPDGVGAADWSRANWLYVINGNGTITTRYDERMLSNTKVSHMYSPGSEPVTFEIDGFRFGCALGMEVHFPELFLEYEQLDVDCVLFSTVGRPFPYSQDVFATEAQAHAATNSYWVSYATSARDAAGAPSGIVSPDGEWVGRCTARDSADVTVVDLHDNGSNLARPWRRKARSGIYEPHAAQGDPRSECRTAV